MIPFEEVNPSRSDVHPLLTGFGQTAPADVPRDPGPSALPG
jgi:hypothetical protein